jgi:hypothetical protein
MKATMGLFDRWRRRAASISTSAATSSAATSSATTHDGVAEFLVPDGHKVGMHRPALCSSVDPCEGGIWLVDLFGRLTGDEPEVELEKLLAEVEQRMRGPRPRVVLNNTRVGLSCLMAPNEPELLVLQDGMVVWSVNAAGLAGAARAPWLVQRWLRFIYTVGTRGTPPAQMVYLHGTKSPRARAIAALVRGLGLDVRTPQEWKEWEECTLAEVHRPEGVIISLLLGEPLAPDDPADTSSLTVNQAKDRAEEGGNAERLHFLEAEERHALENKLAPAEDEPRVSHVGHAWHLRRLLQAVNDEGDTARPALYEELLRREVPLLHIVDRETKAGQLHPLPGGVVALPVYPDENGVNLSAPDHGMKRGTFAIAAMPPSALFSWVASESGAIAMYLCREAEKPVYVVLTADVVKALAEGRMPGSTSPAVEKRRDFAIAR